VVNTIEALDSGLGDVADIVELAAEENDGSLLNEGLSDLEALESRLEILEFRRMFSGEMDSNSAFLDIQAGSGGTEAQDWAEMLLRMEMWQVLKALPFMLMANMRLAGSEQKRVCTDWSGNHRSIRVIAGILHSHQCSCRLNWTMTLK
jgi:protein subunit release factor A